MFKHSARNEIIPIFVVILVEIVVVVITVVLAIIPIESFQQFHVPSTRRPEAPENESKAFNPKSIGLACRV